MNTQPAARRAIAASLTALAVTGLTFGPGVSAAQARPLPTSYAHLVNHGSSSHTGKTTLSVEGRYGASSLNHAKLLLTKAMDLWLMGDDSVSDDYLCSGGDPDWLFAKADGAYFAKTFTVPTNELDEDYGKDEVYAEIYLYGDGGRTIYSSNIAGSSDGPPSAERSARRRAGPPTASSSAGRTVSRDAGGGERHLAGCFSAWPWGRP